MRIKQTTIKIMSTNVGRSSEAHEIALDLASKSKIDVLLVQEPYIYKDRTRKITRKHPLYECFSPLDDWTQRPRVLTYARKNRPMKFTQTRPFDMGEQGVADILFITIKAIDNPPLQVINIYNAPPGATYPGAAITLLLTHSNFQLPPETILAGDFNLHHQDWHPSYGGKTSAQARLLTNWLDSKNLSFISVVISTVSS